MKKRKKADPLLAQARVKRVLSVMPLSDADDNRHYWQRQSIQARLRHMELLRRINYGTAATGRLQRFLEVVQPKAR